MGPPMGPIEKVQYTSTLFKVKLKQVHDLRGDNIKEIPKKLVKP